MLMSGAVGAGTSGAAPAAPSATAHPARADVATPLASNVRPNTYGAVVGYNPLPQACGDPNPVAVLGAMSQLVRIGVGRVRCDLNWWTVQPHDRWHYDWAIYDNVVNAAAHFGIQVLFDMSFTPPWARPNPLPRGALDPSHVPPKHNQDFVHFAIAAAQRYSPNGKARPKGLVGSVNEWEIWNEPNLWGGWTPPDPARYGGFLRAVAVNIHKVNRNAVIISGGLAPAGNVNGNIAPANFVAGMVPSGALKQIQGVGIHPYTFPAYPNEQLGFNPFFSQVPAIYYVMLWYGIGNLKIWATEIGWPTSSQSSQSLRFWDGIQVGTEAQQAKQLPLTLTTWFKFPWTGPLYLYAERDKCTNNSDWLCKMGIERTNGSQKPAWNTVHQQLLKPIQH